MKQIDLVIVILYLLSFTASAENNHIDHNQEQIKVDNTLEKLSVPNTFIKFKPNFSVVSNDSLSSHNHDKTSNTNEHHDLELKFFFSYLPNELISASFSLFETIPSINQVEVQYISDHQQNIAPLDAENNTLNLSNV